MSSSCVVIPYIAWQGTPFSHSIYIPAPVQGEELKILELIRQGISYRKVAEELGLSKSTVMRIVRDSQESLLNQK